MKSLLKKNKNKKNFRGWQKQTSLPIACHQPKKLLLRVSRSCLLSWRSKWHHNAIKSIEIQSIPPLALHIKVIARGPKIPWISKSCQATLGVLHICLKIISNRDPRWSNSGFPFPVEIVFLMDKCYIRSVCSARVPRVISVWSGSRWNGRKPEVGPKSSRSASGFQARCRWQKKTQNVCSIRMSYFWTS